MLFRELVCVGDRATGGEDGAWNELSKKCTQNARKRTRAFYALKERADSVLFG